MFLGSDDIPSADANTYTELTMLRAIMRIVETGADPTRTPGGITADLRTQNWGQFQALIQKFYKTVWPADALKQAEKYGMVGALT